MKLVDLAVIGAGLAGCSVLARLNQLGFHGSQALVEAGRGPGGRTATRRRRGHQTWRLDHGAPGFNLSTPGNPSLSTVLAPLRSSGILRREWGVFVGLDHRDQLVEVPNEEQLEGEWLRGHPTMASVCEGLLGKLLRTFTGLWMSHPLAGENQRAGTQRRGGRWPGRQGG